MKIDSVGRLHNLRYLNGGKGRARRKVPCQAAIDDLSASYERRVPKYTHTFWNENRGVEEYPKTKVLNV